MGKRASHVFQKIVGKKYKDYMNGDILHHRLCITSQNSDIQFTPNISSPHNEKNIINVIRGSDKTFVGTFSSVKLRTVNTE